MTAPRNLTPTELKRHPLPPVVGSDKDGHGRILIIAGSRDVPGAALLTAHGAMRAGAGKLQLAAPDDIAVHLGIAMPEAMVVGYATARDGGFSRRAVTPMLERLADIDVVVAGPGLRGNPAAERLAGELCRAGKRVVLDAALLHALPQRADDARAASVPPILLPHAGEMASLLGCDIEEVEADPLGAGRQCAERYDALVLVKGVKSHIVAPGGPCWRYAGGGPGLGVSGSGDVLAGIVGGLLARGATPLDALLWGVWLHGEAGRRLGETVGPVGFLSREIPGEVPALIAQAVA
ncbi:NAD(P)H-hydrate dehydratase [Sphingomonas rhizophila]|uniref:ADP-dependent (S)-NAD(P)H-hydrate dehydratase n=1 Tax=Sphingomonas rhizophila TaxID=2071607 RepID=A0A7G9SB88_9SPHN|nr:NAD(P)H-hydrate dehydratase [Sphingomonas rhizophila]QNN65113.1 NAD(P)H-hydrate dehydratase [Sphingomonas rhizophila]